MRHPVGALAAAFLTATLLSCGDPEVSLHEVPAPPLDELSETSQEQYRDLRTEIDRARDATQPTESSKAWGDLGQWYEAYRFFGGAELAYDNAHRLEPREPRWPYHLGRLAVRAGDESEAEALLRQALDLAPGHVATEVRLAELLLSQSRQDEAQALFRNGLDKDESCARCRAGLADIALKNGELATAAEQLERAILDQPDATPLNYQLGIVYRQQGRAEEAEELLARASRNAAEHRQVILDDSWLGELQGLNQSVATHQRLGTEEFRKGRWAAAEREYRLAVAEDPGNVKTRQNLALALARQGRIEEAILEVEVALELAPQSLGAHNKLAMLLIQTGRSDEAEAHLLSALETDPDAKRAHFNLAQLRLRSNRPQEALAHFDRAVELDPRMGMARHGRALALWNLDRRQEAIERLRADLEAQPDNQSLLNLLARFYVTAAESSLRDESRALDLVNQAARSGENVAVAETRAMVLAQLGRFDEAGAWQRAALVSLNRTRQRPAFERARKRLELYEAGRPVDEAWAVDESPLASPVKPPRDLSPGSPSADS